MESIVTALVEAPGRQKTEVPAAKGNSDHTLGDSDLVEIPPVICTPTEHAIPTPGNVIPTDLMYTGETLDARSQQPIRTSSIPPTCPPSAPQPKTSCPVNLKTANRFPLRPSTPWANAQP
jgi:hypothetical protein